MEGERHAGREPAAEALAARALEAHVDRALGQSLRAEAARDRPREQPADAAVLVLHLQVDPHGLAALERGLGEADQLVIAVVVEHGVLLPDAPARDLRRSVGRCEQPG